MDADKIAFAEKRLARANLIIEETLFIEAINLADQAFEAFVSEEEYAGAIRCMAKQVNAWRHLFQFSKARWGDPGEVVYLHRCEQSAEVMMQLLDNEEDAETQTHLAYYRGAV